MRSPPARPTTSSAAARGALTRKAQAKRDLATKIIADQSHLARKLERRVFGGAAGATRAQAVAADAARKAEEAIGGDGPITQEEIDQAVALADAAAQAAAELSAGGDLVSAIDARRHRLAAVHLPPNSQELAVWRHSQRNAKSDLQSRMALDPEPLEFATTMSPRTSLERDDRVIKFIISGLSEVDRATEASEFKEAASGGHL